MTGIHLVPQVTAGYIWGQIILEWTLPILAILIGIGVGMLFATDTYTGKMSWKSPIIGTLSGLVVAGGFFGIFLAANWPIQTQYHEYVPTTITVEQIGSRFIGGQDSGTTQRFVFLDKSGTPYAVDDTRASLVKTGNVVTLMCVREWQANGVPGFACNWGEMGPNG